MLGLFPRERFPERDPGPERELRARLRQVLGGDRVPTSRERMLIALRQPYGLARGVVAREDRRAAERRARETAREAPCEAVTEGVRRSVQADTTAAVIAATSAAVASSGGDGGGGNGGGGGS